MKHVYLERAAQTAFMRRNNSIFYITVYHQSVVYQSIPSLVPPKERCHSNTPCALQVETSMREPKSCPILSNKSHSLSHLVSLITTSYPSHKSKALRSWAQTPSPSYQHQSWRCACPPSRPAAWWGGCPCRAGRLGPFDGSFDEEEEEEGQRRRPWCRSRWWLSLRGPRRRRSCWTSGPLCWCL